MERGRIVLAAGIALLSVVAAPVARAEQNVSNQELKRQLDILAGEVQKLKMGEAGANVRADRSQYGFGPAASKVYRTEHGVSLGGYGEFLYQHFADDNHNGTPSAVNDQTTMLRAVLYTGYRFDESWLLNTELEVENATTEGGGSVSIEFAYLDHLMIPEFNARLGLLLLPMGFINELHEPTVFLGTQRPDVETYLIPATWSDNGLGFYGDLGKTVSYKQYFVTGLNASNFDSKGIRNGRTGGSQSNASHWASVTRLDYTGTPGFIAGISAYVGASSTEAAANKGGGMKVPLGIYDFHIDWRYRGVQLRSVGVISALGDIGALDNARNFTGNQSVGDLQRGVYIEGGYDVLSGGASTQSLIPFVRWEYYDTQAGVPAGFQRNPANLVRLLTAGVNYKPMDQIVLKADYRDYFLGDGTGVNQASVSAGYVF